MSTAKRERQRQNRSLRIAAAEAAAKKAATARRVKLIGTLAVIAALFLAGLAFWQSLNADDVEVVTSTDTGSLEVDADPADLPDDADDLTGADEPELETASGGQSAVDGEAAEQSGDGGSSEEVNEVADVPEGCPALDGSSGKVIDFDGPQPQCIDPDANYTAVFDTSEGEMRFDLHTGEVPGTVNNFVTLARWGYYDDTLLFRTDPSIDIIQGGSPHTNSPSDPGPGYTIADEPEFELSPESGALVGPYRYQPGQLVMARSAGPDSAGAQFFITTGDKVALLDSQGTYVVFGNTDEAGLGVAQSIMSLHVDTGNLGGAPSRDVTVHSVTIEESA